MKLNKKTVVKRVVRFVVGSCVTATVSQALANNTAPQNAFEKTEVVVGSVVVGMVAADYAGRWTDKVVDDFANGWTESKEDRLSS